MSIEVSCECAMTYRLPDRMAGKRCRCRECGDSIRVPNLDDEVDESDESDVSESASESESTSGSEHESHDEERPAARKKAPARPPLKARMKSQPSESIHQMSPLNLSESRCIDPPAARARIKKAKAAAAKVNAKKRAPVGPESESEIDTAPRPAKKSKLEKKSKKKKAGKRPAEEKRALRRRSDEESEDERPKKKKKGTKADAKVEKKSAKKRRRDEDEADDSDAEENAEGEEKPKLSPRQQQRRQQIIMLGGSFGALIAVAILFLVINSVSASRKEAREQRFKDAKAKVAAARELARTGSDITAADKAYTDAIAFVTDPAATMPEPEELGEFSKDFKNFQAEQQLFKTVAEARSKLASDPEAAFNSFNALVNPSPSNELIRELGLQGLIQTNNPAMAQICMPHANSSVPAIKALARKGVVEFGGKEAAALIANVIREEGSSTPLGKRAIERALEPTQMDPALIVAAADKATEPTHQLAALNKMSQLLDPSFKPACERLKTSSNDEVCKLAARVLDELRGQDKSK